METKNDTANRKEATLFLEHVNLLQRMGWWDECERFLLSYGSEMLSPEELEDHIRQVKEKQRIYEKVSAPGPDGNTYIGEDDVARMEKGPVTLVYHLKDRHIDVAHVYRSTLLIVEAVRSRLFYDPEKININLHGEQSEILFARRQSGDASRLHAGTCDGTIHLRASAFYSAEPQRMAVVIAHEYVHQAVFDMTRNRCPRWLDEGLALVLSQDLSEPYQKALAEGIESEMCFPIDALDGGALFDAGKGPATLAYAQSCSLVMYLEKQIGWEGIRRLLKMIGRMPPEKALQAFSLNYYLLEKQWKRWARGRTVERHYGQFS